MTWSWVPFDTSEKTTIGTDAPTTSLQTALAAKRSSLKSRSLRCWALKKATLQSY